MVTAVSAHAVDEPWHNSADAYSRSFAHLCAGTVSEILARLDPDEGPRLVLDIGTGTGTVAAAVRATGLGVIGMDRDQSMTTLAALRHPEIAFIRAALPHLPCAGGSFDTITANFVINHTPDPRAAARELLRALRVGGQLLATIWTSTVGSLNQLWNDVMRIASVTSPPGVRLSPELDFERSVLGFAAVLVEVGFDDVDCQELQWEFQIAPAQLWSAVDAGIAVIGQTYRAQDAAGRERMRVAYEEITNTRCRAGVLHFPSTAVIASAHRVR